MSSNPYTPPATEAGPPRSEVALHSLNAVMIATFLGSILGGGLVIASNYRRLAEPDKALKTIGSSLVGGAALLGLLMLIPASVPIPSVAYLLPQLYGMRAIAQQLQGTELEAHERANRAFASNWHAAGWGLLAMLVVGVEAVVYAFMLPGVEA